MRRRGKRSSTPADTPTADDEDMDTGADGGNKEGTTEESESLGMPTVDDGGTAADRLDCASKVNSGSVVVEQSSSGSLEAHHDSLDDGSGVVQQEPVVGSGELEGVVNTSSEAVNDGGQQINQVKSESAFTRRILHGYEIQVEISNKKFTAYIDCGSSSNLISSKIVSDINLEVDPSTKEFKVADTRIVKAQGAVTEVSIRSGEFEFHTDLQVFPRLEHEILLGIPWLVKYNPSINWVTGAVVINKDGQEFQLPRRKYDHVQMPSKMKVEIIQDMTTFMDVTRNDAMGVLTLEPAVDVGPESEVELLIRPDMPDSVKEVLRRYQNVFLEDLPKGAMPVRQGIHEFRIDLLPDTQPIYRPIYKLSPKELEEVRRQIEYLLDRDLIRRSKSPWGAPILFAGKKDGSLRMCLDYRWLNARTVKNRYPLPLPEELLDRLSGKQYFTRIDLRSGYWQMPIRKQDQPRTAFRSRYGHFEFKVVPFGLSNAPPQFMAMMNDILADELDKTCVVFLDDIIIYSDSAEEHASELATILAKLQENHLYAKAKKCMVCVTELDFVGYWVSKDGITPHRSKVQAVLEWPPPKNVSDVRSYLGMVSYYRKFIRSFSDMAAPLNQLLRKNEPFVWGPQQQKSYKDLQEALSSAPVLRLADPLKKYTLATDASDYALGGVLMQESEKGYYPLAFISRTLRSAEKNYDTYDKEMLGIIYALQQWRHYLEGAPGGVEVWTDHQPATHLLKQKDMTRTQVRYLKQGLMQSIAPTLKYIKGKANVVADALSRNPASRGQVGAISTVEADPEVSKQWIHDLRSEEETKMTMEQLEAGKTLPHFRLGPHGILYWTGGKQMCKIVVPRTRIRSILEEFHDGPIRGHPGVERTMAAIQTTYWWKRQKSTVQDYVRSCIKCQEMKNETSKQKGLLCPIPIPERKWQQVTTDLVTDLPESKGYTAVAVFVDRLTKYCKFAPCTKEVTAEGYAQLFFDNVFRSYGLPESIISDRDPRFMSRFWTELFRMTGTKLKYSTAHHPQTDGQSEVTIRTLENTLRPYVEENPSGWAGYLAAAEFAVNNAMNHSTRTTPFYLMTGQHPRMLEPASEPSENASAAAKINEMKVALESARQNLLASQERMRKAANQHRRDKEYSVGDKVWLSAKHLPMKAFLEIPRKIRRKFVGPFTVSEKISPVAYTLALPKDWRIHPTFHVSRFKDYWTSDDFPRDDFQPIGELAEGEQEAEYEVEAIIGCKGRGRRKKYLVKWKGYAAHENSWEPRDNLTGCEEEVKLFHLRRDRMKSAADPKSDTVELVCSKVDPRVMVKE